MALERFPSEWLKACSGEAAREASSSFLELEATKENLANEGKPILLLSSPISPLSEPWLTKELEERGRSPCPTCTAGRCFLQPLDPPAKSCNKEAVSFSPRRTHLELD